MQQLKIRIDPDGLAPLGFELITRVTKKDDCVHKIKYLEKLSKKKFVQNFEKEGVCPAGGLNRQDQS